MIAAIITILGLVALALYFWCMANWEDVTKYPRVEDREEGEDPGYPETENDSDLFV